MLRTLQQGVVHVHLLKEVRVACAVNGLFSSNYIPFTFQSLKRGI